MRVLRNVCRKRRRGGSAAIEFALVGPLMVVMLAGMVTYGGWLWVAQSVQTLATESARAAVGGLDAAERIRLAQSFVDAEAEDGAGLARNRLTVAVDSDEQAIRVQLAFDARDHWMMTMAGLLPAPPAMIRRTAVVRTGGY